MGLLTFGLRFTIWGHFVPKWRHFCVLTFGPWLENLGDEALWLMDASWWNQCRISHKYIILICNFNPLFLFDLRGKPVGCSPLDSPAPSPNSSSCYAWDIWPGVIGLPGGEHLPGNTDSRTLSKYMCRDALWFDSSAWGYLLSSRRF